MSAITLRKIRNTDLFGIYKKLLLKETLDGAEKECLLKIAVIIINAGDEYSQDFGYRIVVLYGNLN